MFDEIQALPDITTTLKFFCLDGRFDVICSGSLLGIHYRQIESNSVGYKFDMNMFSLDFEEFLWAKGYGDEIVQDLLNHVAGKIV
ncbi:AAA family ATPase [Absicoccus intestinalis]|uniref:AAA family ATPase n=1 Tax=Absicoccus intestinalis TaxID=2926319 RepID=UPI00351CFC41